MPVMRFTLLLELQMKAKRHSTGGWRSSRAPAT